MKTRRLSLAARLGLGYSVAQFISGLVYGMTFATLGMTFSALGAFAAGALA